MVEMGEPDMTTGLATVCFMRRDGKVLLQRRAPGRVWAGRLNGPGGKVDPGETPAAAVVREVAEEAGLQVLDRDGRWLDINPAPGTLVCNIGDMLQRLTNHVLPSTTHRVVNPVQERADRPRYSMPFFLHFNPDFEIRSLPACVGPDRPDRYPDPITADEYLRQRLREIRLL